MKNSVIHEAFIDQVIYHLMSKISMFKAMRFYCKMNFNPENMISKYW